MTDNPVNDRLHEQLRNEKEKVVARDEQIVLLRTDNESLRRQFDYMGRVVDISVDAARVHLSTVRRLHEMIEKAVGVPSSADGPWMGDSAAEVRLDALRRRTENLESSVGVLHRMIMSTLGLGLEVPWPGNAAAADALSEALPTISRYQLRPSLLQLLALTEETTNEGIYEFVRTLIERSQKLTELRHSSSVHNSVTGDVSGSVAQHGNVPGGVTF